MREEILKAEQHLLRILNYDLTNPHEDDYKFFLNYLKIIDGFFVFLIFFLTFF